jgi:hypothetical protein
LKGSARAVRESEADANDGASAGGSEDDDEQEYEIDSIRRSRYRKFRGKKILEFFIHWKGYDSSEDSWTGADQFDDDDPPVLDFYRKNPGAAGDKNVSNGPKSVKLSKKADKMNEVRSDSEVEEVVPKPKAKGRKPMWALSDSDEEVARPSKAANGRFPNGRDRTHDAKSKTLGSDSEADIVALDSNPSAPNPLTPKVTSGNRSSPRKSAVNGHTSQPVKSSLIRGNGSLLSYFSTNNKKGKENVDSATQPISSRRKEAPGAKAPPKPVQDKPAPKTKEAKPATKKQVKRKAKSDSGSDFQMEDEGDADDSEAEVADEEVQSDDLASVGEDEMDDVIGELIVFA